MSPLPIDNIMYTVMLKQTLQIIKGFRDGGYQYKHIYIDHHPEYLKIYTSHATLGNLTHTLYFPTVCNPSHFQLPPFLHDTITITNSSDDTSQNGNPYINTCTCDNKTLLNQPEK